MSEPATAKRILYVITKATWGGAQRYVFDLAVAAKQRGYEVGVAHGTEGLLVEKLKEAGVRTRTLPSVERDVAMLADTDEALHPKTMLSSLKQEWSALKELIKLLKEERPDVLHLNSSKAGFLGALAGRAAKVPRIIFTAHGWAFNERRPLWQKAVFRFFYALTIWLSHETICVSDAVCRDMSWLPFSRMTVVRHGMDAPVFVERSLARNKLWMQQMDKTWLGMVAELHPTKRVEDAIDALMELKELRPELVLVVLGEGEARQALEERIAHYGLEDRVRLVGFVPDAATYLKALDIFLMPSRTEALGLALIEAGYAGLPAIASRVGGMPEIVRHKDTGLLVPKENPHALARAIRTFVEHPDEAAAYAQALEKRVAERYSKVRMLEETFLQY